MSLAARRAAALAALASRQPPAGQRFPGETQPSGDMPDDPWEAEVYLAERDCPDWVEEHPWRLRVDLGGPEKPSQRPSAARSRRECPSRATSP